MSVPEAAVAAAYLSPPLDDLAALTLDDPARVHLVCVRPTGPFSAFDDRITKIGTRFVRFVRVTILRTWDHAAQLEWLGFVSTVVPTVLLVRGGRIIAKSVGDIPYLALEQIIQEAAH